MSSQILTWAGWSFLPPLVTDLVVSFLDRSSIAAGLWTPAAKGTPAYFDNRRKAFTAVISVYIVYSVYTSIQVIFTPNWYQILAVRQDVDESALKAASRAVSKRYHPDKAGLAGEMMFIAGREAYEGLSDWERRYAYDRFGPAIVNWKNCVTIREFMMRGLGSMALWYVVTGSIQVGLGYFNKVKAGAYWRTYAFLVIFAAELALLVGPYSSFSPFPDWIALNLPPWANFQYIELLHQLWITLSLALNQLGPHWAPQEPTVEVKSKEEEEMQLLSGLNQLIGLAREMEGASVALFDEGWKGVEKLGEERGVDAEKLLKKEMEDCLIDDKLRTHPATAAAWKNAVAPVVQ